MLGVRLYEHKVSLPHNGSDPVEGYPVDNELAESMLDTDDSQGTAAKRGTWPGTGLEGTVRT